ncbi:DUF6377 domain-containing protein [Parabacteroides sp. OttesenSCG-928-G06]|nr:DUF6377 domain-containing protein [Parabacteroides sp. OttesenSCG-928-G06]
MRKGLLFLILFISSLHYTSARSELDSLFLELDNKIKNEHVYTELKENRIESLKNEKRKANTPIDKVYSLNALIYNEYRAYISDSAIYYMNENLDIAFQLNSPEKINETSIDQAKLFSDLGMYKEALDILENIDRNCFDDQQRLDYYSSYWLIYSGLAGYTQNNRDRGKYALLSNTYRDSILGVAPPSSEEYLRIKEAILRQEGKTEEALKINDTRISQAGIGSPLYALVTFHRSLLYRNVNDPEKEKEYLILSAIADIQSAIKDNASIPILANILMQEGNVNRAHRYVRFSLDNINDYNTRLRSSEIIAKQLIIDKAYQQKNEAQTRKLHVFLILISVLSLLLIISVFYVYKQMRKGVVISNRLKETNSELISLNKKLHDMNNELHKINMEVIEADQIKEEYISYFLSECSKYIEKLDAFRKMVNKKIQDKQIESLYKVTKNNNLKEDELKELFINFDTMFIHLFPDFVEELNSLLLDEEQIVLKKGEVLNVELRIYALIRLGIDDSSKIANFLGYSVNTIYNYRAKVKNKAKIAREDFEWTVKRIGTFSK